MRKIKSAFIATICATFFASSSFALTPTTTMQSQITLNGACTITIPTVNFGVIRYNSDTVKLTSLKTLCSKGVTGQVSMTMGNRGSTAFDGERAARFLKNDNAPDQNLKYLVSLPGKDYFAEESFLTIEGNGTEVSNWVSFLILRGQYLTPGIYTDNLTVTISY